MNLQILLLVALLHLVSLLWLLNEEWFLQKTFLHSCWRMREFISFVSLTVKSWAGALKSDTWHLAIQALSLNARLQSKWVPNLNASWIEVEDLTPMYLSNILMFGIFTLFCKVNCNVILVKKWYHLCQIRNQVFIFYFFPEGFCKDSTHLTYGNT